MVEIFILIITVSFFYLLELINNMNKTNNLTIKCAVLLGLVLSPVTLAAEVCEWHGPQTPRDIDNLTGTNKRMFAIAPEHKDLNLCNIHFHNNAEHKASNFSIYAGKGKKGYGGGYQCNISRSLSPAELKPTKAPVCKGLKPGDTIEVHWVHTSADIIPGPTLGACLSQNIGNPTLRVEAQVFTLVNDATAMDFGQMSYDGNRVNGYHQAKMLPNTTGLPVEFIGSTTGPKYNAKECSTLGVTWNVRPQCAKLDINSLADWCKGNVFKEDHAHGVRELVTDPRLLSQIK